MRTAFSSDAANPSTARLRIATLTETLQRIEAARGPGSHLTAGLGHDPGVEAGDHLGVPGESEERLRVEHAADRDAASE